MTFQVGDGLGDGGRADLKPLDEFGGRSLAEFRFSGAQPVFQVARFDYPFAARSAS